MTSKEDFNKLREEYYNEFLNEEFDEIGVFNSIEKDLEILDIFMNNLFVGDDSLSIIMDDLRNFEDFDKVKEWLNEKD